MSLAKTIYLKDYQAPPYLIDTVDLTIELDEICTRVKSILHYRRAPGTASDLPLILEGEAIKLQSLSVNGKAWDPTHYTVHEGKLSIKNLPSTGRISIENTLSPKENTQLSGLYLSRGTFCTQCEAHGFRRITFYLDRPDVMAIFRTKLIADKASYPILLSNGNLIESGEAGSKHWTVWEDPFKKPCYLFALVAGDLHETIDKFETCSGKSVDLRIYVEKGNQDKVAHAMHALKQAMRWDELEFGREYDLARFMIVAVSDFNMGAMENKGLNIFNDKYVLANPTVATDQDFEGISSVIAHEYFHNWTGNRITCRDWFQLSLKEGLTVFRDQEFSASVFSPTTVRINEVQFLRSKQFAEDAGPMAHPVRPDSYIEINNFYTATVYNKGAELIRMMHTLLGKAGFRRGMDWYFEHYDGQAVTTEEFVQSMERANQIELKQFRLWYTQAGTPSLHVSDVFDEKNEKYYLSIRQHCPATPLQKNKFPMHISVRTALFSESGKPIDLKVDGVRLPENEVVLSVTQAEQTFCFEGVKEKPVPSLLRQFSAPVKLDYAYDDKALLMLMKHETDGFNQFEAMQKWMINTLLQGVKDYRSNTPMSIASDFYAVVESLFETVDDLSLLSEMLTLPSEYYLAGLMDKVDVEGIHYARQTFVSSLSLHMKEIFLAAYQREYDFKTYDLSDSAKRKLKNTCLGYLLSLNDPDLNEIGMNQYRQANNMTDQLGAFSGFVKNNNDYREWVIESFYEQWKHEHLIIDKWFSIQAMSFAEDVMMRVSRLALHPDFNLHQPNRVRSLIAAFCSSNHRHFHHISGEGYRFLSEKIIQLDDINPQIAARLLEPLTHYKRYDENRAERMKVELEKIHSKPKLSRDVFEIIEKTLNVH